MNGLSLSPLLAGTAIGKSIGTLSAKPEAMFINALPFRLQLEASTAPLRAAAKSPGHDGEERFALPKLADGLVDPFAARTSDQRGRGDAQSSDDQDDTPGAPLAALAVMIDIPEYFAPPASAPVGTPGAEVANGAPFTDLQASASMATGLGTLRPIGSSVVPAMTEVPIASAMPAPVPTPPTDHPSAAARPQFADDRPMPLVATVVTAAVTPPILDPVVIQAPPAPLTPSALPKFPAPQALLELAQRTGYVREAIVLAPSPQRARTPFAAPQPQALPTGSPAIASADAPVLNNADTTRPAVAFIPASRPAELTLTLSPTVKTASFSYDMTDAKPPMSVNPVETPAADTAQSVSDRGEPKPARQVSPGSDVSAAPNVVIAAPVADGTSPDSPAPATETTATRAQPHVLAEPAVRYLSPRSSCDTPNEGPLTSSPETAADSAIDPSATDRSNRRQTPEVRRERPLASETTKSPANEPTPRAEIASHQTSPPVATALRPGFVIAQPLAADIAPDAANPVTVTPPQVTSRADGMTTGPDLGLARFERRTSVAAPRSADHAETKATIDRVPETRIEPGIKGQRLEALATARTNTRVAPQSGPMLAADFVAPPTQSFAPVPAAQTQVAFAGEATQPTLSPSAHIPFDQKFGQRVGAAIGAAMNAMSVKNGMLLLQISPERLGKIEIEIDSKMERLQITTENEAVRGAIAQAHGRIEHELRQAGQRIATIEVETRDAAGSQLNNGAADQRGGQNSGQQPLPGRHDLRARMHDQGGSQPGDPDASRPSSNVLYA